MLLEDLSDGLFSWFQYIVFGLFVLGMLVGCGFVFLLGIVLAWRAAVLTRHGIQVEGRVVERPNVPGNEVSDTIVEFTDILGNTQRKKLPASSSDHPPVGQSMRLIYNPSDLNEISGASLDGLWMAPLICCVCGGLGVVAVLWCVGQQSGVLPLN